MPGKFEEEKQFRLGEKKIATVSVSILTYEATPPERRLTVLTDGQAESQRTVFRRGVLQQMLCLASTRLHLS